MPKNYPGLISVLTAAELEDFVDDWLHQRCKDYHSHERWSGPGDRGRDVTGYVADRRMSGPWDNFQCKQLGTKLSEKALFVELGKIFMHAAAGAYSLPRAYIFVAPKGVVRNVREFVAHPDRLQQAFLDRWDSEIADALVENATVKLSVEITAAIHAFNFKNVHWLDATQLAKDPACMPALVKWFDADPGQSPRGVVPALIDTSESAYMGQLLNVYTQCGLGSYADPAAALACPEVGPHLKIQRTRFFDARAFDLFYRDSTPEELVTTFRDEIHHGVVDLHKRQQQLRAMRVEIEAAPTKNDRDPLPVGPGSTALFAFGETVKAVLTAWGFPDADKVQFDEKANDITIAGKARDANGKGVRAVMHAAFTVALALHCIGTKRPHPGFLVLDTPLLTYREPLKSKHGDLSDDEKALKATSLAEKFYRHLASLRGELQVIIIENSDPPEAVLPLAHIEVFTGEANNGRYGLLAR